MQSLFQTLLRFAWDNFNHALPARGIPHGMPRPRLRRLWHRASLSIPIMLYTIAVILLIAWLLGMVSSYTIGGFIHILLVVAIIMVLVRVIQGRAI